MKSPMLGVLGGLGPASSVYFYDLLTSHTKASCDADHIDLILSSGASTPDRTRYILGQSTENPLTHMLRDAQGLIDFGADMIAIPCNTAHYFYDELAGRLERPVINIIRETVTFIRSLQIRRVGILATDGTIFSGAYQHVCGEYGISCVVPEQEEQKQIMRLIYEDIKGGREPDLRAFKKISERLLDRGCERLILACTELSLLKKNGGLSEKYVDSLEVLACRCITLCGKKAVGFSQELLNFEVNR